MDRRSTTVGLLLVILVVGLLASGRLKNIWAAVFGEEGTAGGGGKR